MIRLVRIARRQRVAARGARASWRPRARSTCCSSTTRGRRLAAAAGAAPGELPELPSELSRGVASVCEVAVSRAGVSRHHVRGLEQLVRRRRAGRAGARRGGQPRRARVSGARQQLAGDFGVTSSPTAWSWTTRRPAPHGAISAQPILAADLQLGAGPLVTALAEGARVVVAGCYDGAAPAIAASRASASAGSGRTTPAWRGRRGRASGDLVAAARWRIAVAQSVRPAGDCAASAHRNRRARRVHSRPFIARRAAATPSNCSSGCDAGQPQDPAHLHADVRMRRQSTPRVMRSGTNATPRRGLHRRQADGHWRLEVLYQAGFFAEAMVEFAARRGRIPAAPDRRGVSSALCDADDERSLVTVQELSSTAGDGAAASWLHLALPVERRARRARSLSIRWPASRRANPELLRLPAGRPVVQVECNLWPRASRAARSISPSTRRPAQSGSSERDRDPREHSHHSQLTAPPLTPPAPCTCPAAPST